MSTSLPERPDLTQLRRQAKELRDGARRGEASAVERFVRRYGSAPQGAVTLAAAQLAIARELGFASWPRLKAAVEAQATSSGRWAEAFVTASVQGHLCEAATILDAAPDVAGHSLTAAAVLGEARQVVRMLAVDPAAAVAIDGVRGWPPLLYACYSHWHQIDPRRAAGMAEVVRLLLDAGASPNTNNGARYPRTALKGSVEVNNPDITRVLLEAGANPDVGQPIGEAAGHGDHRCLELLLSHGARVARTWAVGAAVHAGDPRAVIPERWHSLRRHSESAPARRSGRRPKRSPTRQRTPPLTSLQPSWPQERILKPATNTASARCAWPCGPGGTRRRPYSPAVARRMTAPTSTVSSAPAGEQTGRLPSSSSLAIPTFVTA